MPPSDDPIRPGDVLRIEDLLRHEDWLRRFVRRLVADPGTADDVVQETWLSVLRKPQQVRHARGFLARIARNAAISRARRHRVRSRHERSAARAEAIESAADAVERLEAQRVVAEALLSLPEDERVAVTLQHVQGLTPAEIARRLGVQPETIRQRCHRGLERVRHRLRRQLGEDWRTQAGVCALMSAPAKPAVAATGAAAGASSAAAVLASALTTTLMMTMKTKLAVAASTILVVWLGVVLWSPGAPDPADLVPVPVEVETADGLPGRSPVVAGRGVANGTGERQEVAPAVRAAPSGPEVPVDVGATIRIEVRDPSGAPIPDATVFHVADDSRSTSRESLGRTPDGSRTRLGMTGHDGGLVLPVPATSGFVDVQHPDVTRRWRMAHSIRIGGTSTRSVAVTRRVVMAPAVAVRGVVRHRDGSPLIRSVRIIEVARELVSFPLPMEDSFRIVGEPRQVEPDGSFALADLPAACSDLVFSVEQRGGVHAVIHRHPVGERDEDIVVWLPADANSMVPPVSVVGRVVTPSGDPILGARVEVTARDEERSVADRTDDAGRFSLEIPRASEARRVLLVSCKGWRPRQFDDLEARLAAAATSGVAVTLAVALDRGALLVGRVLEADGTPVPGVRVLPSSSQTLVGGRSADELHGGVGEPLRIDGRPVPMQAITDGDGGFELAGLDPAPLRLRVLDLRTGFGWTSPEVRPGPARVVLRLPEDRMRRRIAGRVVDRLGQGVARVEVGLSTRVHSVGSLEQWRGRALGVTGPDGNFEFEDVPRHGLHLTISGTGLIGRGVDVPVVDPGEHIEIVVARRCFVRAAFSSASEVAAFAILDRSGERLDLLVKQSGRTDSRSEQEVTAGESPPVAVSDDAVTAVLFDGAGREIGRLPVRLVPDRVVELGR